MKIRVGFSTTNSWISKTIRWFTKGNISHSYIRFYDDFLDEDLVMHADWPGVLIEPAALFEATNIVIEEFEITDPRLKGSIKYNLRHLRKKYDYWNLAYWAKVITFKRWIKRKIKKPVENPTRMICVDFCLFILNRAGITNIAYNSLSTTEFREWFIDNYEEFGWKREIRKVN